MSADRIIFDPKLVGETNSYPFDFTSKINAAGVTISTHSVTASVWSGVDPNPSAIIGAASSVTGQVVSQTITAGVAGVIYLLLAQAATNDGRTLQIEALLAVKPNGP